jgi:uncharacterized membrane protein
MKRFTEILRSAADRLDLPQPSKSNVLLEIAADLEDLFQHYREQGHDEEDSARLVEEKFSVSDDVLLQLSRVHRSAVQRWLERLSDRARSLGERILLFVIVLLTVTAVGMQLAGTTLFRDTSDFIWPLAVIAAAALALSLAKIYQLYVRKDHHVRTLRDGLPTLMFLALAALFVGCFGLVWELFASMSAAAAGDTHPAIPFNRWMFESTATLIASLLVAIVTALAWFLILNKVLRVERAGASLLLE